MKEIEERYLILLEELINQTKLLSIDDELEQANLYFGKSKQLTKDHINSDYVRIVNRFDVSTLTEEEIQRMGELKTVRDGNNFIRSTIQKVSNKEYLLDSINRKIPKNTLVFEIIIGKNTKELKGEEYQENKKAQDKFLKELIKKYTRRLTSQFRYPVIFYIDKEV